MFLTSEMDHIKNSINTANGSSTERQISHPLWPRGKMFKAYIYIALNIKKKVNYVIQVYKSMFPNKII